MKIFGEVARFGVVGTIGFVVDGGVLWLLVSSATNPFLARGISFPIAVLTTWWLNRIWTFASSEKARPRRQLRRYFVVQVVGALTNFIVYVSILSLIEPSAINALYALAVGSFFGMFVNFAGSRLYVFKSVPVSNRDKSR